MPITFDAAAINTSAANLGAIMDDMSAFTALKAPLPDMGQFGLAKWLAQVVQDRRGGIVARAEYLQGSLRDMQSTLQTIAANVTNADGENAAKIAASIADLEMNISQLPGGTTPPLPV